MKNRTVSEPEKILALFPGALGDFVCFLPALKRLAARGNVDLLARTEYADLTPPAVRVRSLECREVARLYRKGGGRDERLTNYFSAYSQIYSWTGRGQREFEDHLRAASRGHVAVFPFLPYGTRIHPTDYYLSCIGVRSPEPRTPTVRVMPDAHAWVHQFWRVHRLEGAKILALAPGSGAPEKNWPAGFYEELADWWRGERGGEVVVILGPVEEERARLDLLFPKAVVVRNLDLAHLAALIRHCDLYAGNDSGVTHLAAAVGAEVFVLFGPTDPFRWAPRGKVTVLRQEVECSPCESAVMKLCLHRKCLTTLTPAKVIRAMQFAGCDVPTRSPELLDKGGSRDYI